MQINEKSEHGCVQYYTDSVYIKSLGIFIVIKYLCIYIVYAVCIHNINLENKFIYCKWVFCKSCASNTVVFYYMEKHF